MSPLKWLDLYHMVPRKNIDFTCWSLDLNPVAILWITEPFCLWLGRCNGCWQLLDCWLWLYNLQRIWLECWTTESLLTRPLKAAFSLARASDWLKLDGSLAAFFIIDKAFNCLFAKILSLRPLPFIRNRFWIKNHKYLLVSIMHCSHA